MDNSRVWFANHWKFFLTPQKLLYTINWMYKLGVDWNIYVYNHETFRGRYDIFSSSIHPNRPIGEKYKVCQPETTKIIIVLLFASAVEPASLSHIRDMSE